MKKQFLFLFTALTVVVMCVGLTACSSDDKDEPGGGGSSDYSTLLVGTWKYTFSGDPSNWYTYTFKSNNTGIFNRPSWNVSYSITYQVDAYDSGSQSGVITIVEEGKAYRYNFRFVGSSTLILDDRAFVKQ